MLEVAHTIMFVGTCLCIMFFCVVFKLGRDYQESREAETLTEEKVQAMIDEAITKALSNIGNASK